jgi:hypothetical protein
VCVPWEYLVPEGAQSLDRWLKLASFGKGVFWTFSGWVATLFLFVNWENSYQGSSSLEGDPLWSELSALSASVPYLSQALRREDPSLGQCPHSLLWGRQWGVPCTSSLSATDGSEECLWRMPACKGMWVLPQVQGQDGFVRGERERGWERNPRVTSQQMQRTHLAKFSL